MCNRCGACISACCSQNRNNLQVVVEVPAHLQRDSLEDPFIALYSTNVQEDNEPMLNFYRQVITEAMQKLLIPDALKALRKDLTEHGREKVLQIIEDKFWCEATMPPLRLQYVAESPDDAPEVRRQALPHTCLPAQVSRGVDISNGMSPYHANAARPSLDNPR